MSRNVQYVTDANGERTAVILRLDEYEDLLEDLHVIRVWKRLKTSRLVHLVKLSKRCETRARLMYEVIITSHAERELKRLDRSTKN
jgi:hypothetical protein